MHDNDVNPLKLVSKLGLNRRQFFAATTGMAAAVAVTGAAAAQAAPGANGVLIPAPRRGIILYTVRDAVSRNPLTSPYASGFKEVLTELSSIGYRQIEFAGLTQNANSEGGANLNTVEGATLLRSWLDDLGLQAEGNHGSVPSTITDANIAAFDTACEIANILGMGHIGTGSDPTSSAYVADWEAAAARWDFYGERASRHGLKLYTHNHDIAYSFLLDSGPLDATGRPTRSSGIRRLEHFLANTDPKHVYLEMDIYWAHVAQYKHKAYTAPDGSVVTSLFDPAAVVAAQTNRFPLFHAKDGKIDTTQANGYVMAPFGQGDIDYSTFLRRVGAKGSHNPMWEMDTAPGNATTAPNQSMELSKVSYDNMAALRG
ncbi:Tat (twin-arginine translocation) pathway signal sequence [Terrabacter sp. Root85]|uniref:sugar phosphate isomerase/epimerase family protein n=1 Tax=unclassified Terrabacter TaxID=2630222 RepID=UPI0006F40E24|nr:MULTISPECIES: TIM barrel protein [unclassified Terrabacter]KRC84383.1 Tat (twin-arginine translocation) pathway signal sequence [Terrabacter sp. Root85]KRF42432.1 Tat (twin-arginine translocation) pathway signal sequence [Terrabacter sp. Soil811]